jgi:hydrogenase expression/formation protein HypC
MCLAIPALLVEKRDHDQALVDLGGIRKPISIALVPEANVGDYVIVHVGHAIGVLDPDEAQKTLAMFAEMQSQTAEGPGMRPSAGPPQAGSAPLGGSEPHEMGSVGV